jgi:hypothetical protein
LNITHAKVSTIANGGDTALIRPADWNANHTLSFRGALVNSTVNQAVGNSTLTVINWGAEVYDTDNIHESVTHPSRLTVPAGVTYTRLSANTHWAANSVGTRYVMIQKNSTDCLGCPVSRKTALGETEDNIHSAILSVTGGDYFELVAYQDCGTSLNFLTSNGSWFAMEIIA